VKAVAALAALVVAAALAVALPASASTPVIKGVDGPGFTITMTPSSAKAGKVKLVVADKSNAHNFHLIGPGVNVKTSVAEISTKTFVITLKKGTYQFVCDPHKSFMKGTFTVK
jgi:plastocyanin